MQQWSRIGGLSTALKLIIAGAITVFIGVATSLPAHAIAVDERTVDSIVIADNYSRIELFFDGGISQAEAEEIRAALAPQAESGHTTMQDGEPIRCGNRVVATDGNGKFEIAYSCTSKGRSLVWGFRLSAQVQAIIVGLVNETGLRWWRNGSERPRNAPHTAAPSYQFHGTMSPVSSGNDIDYQDYLTFRHDLGSGGSGSVSFAGSVILKN
jgi:hypothetical protein